MGTSWTSEISSKRISIWIERRKADEKGDAH